MPLFDGLEKATRKSNTFGKNICISSSWQRLTRERFKTIMITLAHNGYIFIHIWYLFWHLFLGVPFKCITLYDKHVVIELVRRFEQLHKVCKFYLITRNI